MPRSLQQHKPQFTTLALRLSSFFLLLVLSNQSHHVKANIFIYSDCSEGKYQPNSPYVTYLNTLLSSAVNSASQSLYNSFALGNDSSAPAEASIYGLYQCRGDLETRDCATCMASAVNQINLVCPYTYGAILQLDGCFLRYEHIDFLGNPDTSLRYKKCGKSASSDAEFLRRRDAVLANMQGSISFRVSTSGLVEGYAQCIGDLSEADCSSCLADAVVQLKSLCGSSEAADVFLAQCYARYWASGYYDSSALLHETPLFFWCLQMQIDSSHGNDDEVGKTVAIIVGSVAGFAILIVLISFCRTAVH
nr:cysteine-rich repeat secretory protein 15-like isoform X1 [Coffea arabica]